MHESFVFRWKFSLSFRSISMHCTHHRSPTLLNVCDFNSLYLREQNANINTKNYLSSKSVISPISRQKLRLVVTNGMGSNIFILPRTLSSSQREKKEMKKSFKSTGYDVYRSLSRSISQSSSNFDREMNIDETPTLSNSITIDRISPLSNTGLFRTNHLPKIAKQSNKSAQIIKTMSDRIEYLRSTPSEYSYRGTPDNRYYEEEKNQMITPPATQVLSCISKDQTRKELHVYMPAINC